MIVSQTRFIALVVCALSSLSCGSDSDAPPMVGLHIQAQRFAGSEWSTPVNLGATINTSANEQGPTLSKDGRTLFFGSDRDGSLDLWVARRACSDCSWDEPPVKLGSVVNTAFTESGPGLSIDEHMLFFTSNRPGGQGLTDLYVSHRANPKDDLGWESPVGLGPDVNTGASEAGAEYLQSAEDGAANLYFNRAPLGGTADIYYAPLTRDGETRGPATLVSEISHPTATDQGSTLRTDGREIFFFSTRPGGIGGNDLWTSTRRSVHDPWPTPTNLGSPLNSVAAEQQPSLSSDGRTLLFASSRTGGFGGTDIYVSTRTPSGN
ncbi:MAG TPA: hypothetical protein VF962_15150 [Gemmatimonadaceae bacterium]